MKENEYGNSIKEVLIVLICRPYDFKQRKRFKKDSGVFSYDILIDFYLVKNVEVEEKKKLIRYQMIKITEETFKKYKWQDFDTQRFLSDFKNVGQISAMAVDIPLPPRYNLNIRQPWSQPVRCDKNIILKIF